MSMQVMFSSSAVLLFMLLLMCCGSGVVCVGEEVNSVSQSNSVELFKNGETRVSESGTHVSSFSAHSLVGVNGLMVALAAARSNCDRSCCNIEIWSKSLRYEKNRLPSEIIKPNDGDQRMAQAVVSKKTDESHYTNLFGPSAVVKDNKIYILLSNSTRKTPESDGSDVLRDLELVVGTIGTSSGDSQSTITWQAPTSLKNTLKTALGDNSWKDVYASRGKGLLMGGSTVVFPVVVERADTKETQSYGCTVIYSEDGNNWNFPSKKFISEDCIRSTLFEQGGKLFMVTIAQQFHTGKVYISSDEGKTWTEGTEADSNLLINFLKHPQARVGGDVITATINNKNVALLTQRRFIPSGGGSEKPRDQVHLFMTDNKRITSVGPISVDDQISSFCTLLHTGENGELFALCNKGSLGSQSVVLFSLAEQLERIKFVLGSWESTDGKVSSSCTSATKEASCSTMPTSGLVGFLSNNGDSTHWADEYFGMNATVSGGAKVENGFKLSGRGAFIEWRFGGQERNQLYSFADRGLTLVATVTIHDIPESDTPLMSVGLASKAVGLWYGKENHWKGIIAGEGTGTWVKDKPYRVAITVLKGTVSVYIDGKRLGSLDPNFRPNKDGKAPRPPPPGPGGMPHHPKGDVSGVCFGGCGFMHDGDENTAASPFTVTSVLLYNRVLNLTELLPPPPQQSQTTAEEMREATITGKPTVERRSNKPLGGNDSSVHESLSSLLQLFALLALLGSATL